MVGEGAYDVDGREQKSTSACETKVVFTQGEVKVRNYYIMITQDKNAHYTME